MDSATSKLPQFLTTVGPMGWTFPWLEAFDQKGPVGGWETGVADTITPLVADLIAYEIIFERDAA